jgi:hypothetical protein
MWLMSHFHGLSWMRTLFDFLKIMCIGFVLGFTSINFKFKLAIIDTICFLQIMMICQVKLIAGGSISILSGVHTFGLWMFARYLMCTNLPTVGNFRFWYSCVYLFSGINYYTRKVLRAAVFWDLPQVQAWKVVLRPSAGTGLESSVLVQVHLESAVFFLLNYSFVELK